MSIEQIKDLVARTLEVNLAETIKSRKPDYVDARYIMITIMLEENISFWLILEQFDLSRTMIHRIKEEVDHRLRFNIPFKEKYLHCIGELTYIQDKEEAYAKAKIK